MKNLLRPVRSILFALVICFLMAASAIPPARAQAPDLFTPAVGPRISAAAQGESTLRSRFVHVDFAQLVDPSGSPRDEHALPQVSLNIFPDARYVGIVERFERSGSTFSWAGRLDGVVAGTFSMVLADGVFIAGVSSPRGIYEVSSTGGDLYRVDQIDQSSFTDGPDAIPVLLPPPQVSADSVAASSDSADQIDVIVLYTDDARRAEGSAKKMKARVAQAIAETRQSYANSGVTTDVRLVHTQEITYAESTDPITDLTRLQTPSDGLLDIAQTLRKRYGADMVQLIVQSMASYPGACGIGYLMVYNDRSFAPFAYSVVRRWCMVGYFSTPHEWGHNQGAHHDLYVSDGEPTVYPYAHGYVHIGDTPMDSFRTIMAYGNQCYDKLGTDCNRIQHWSNPSVPYGSPPVSTGNTEARNFEVLNNTAPTVANFKAHVIGGNFDTDFTADRSGWTDISGTWNGPAVEGLTNQGTAGKFTSIVHSGNYGDLTYTVTLKRTGIDNASPTALIVRGKSSTLKSNGLWKSSYLFEFNNNGQFRVRRITSTGASKILKGWTAISPAFDPNIEHEFKVVAVGSSLKFSIAGSQVWQGTNTSFYTGRAGIGMYCSADPCDTLSVINANLETTPTN